VICGLITDGRAVVNYALKEAQDYRRQYGQTIPLKILNDRLSSLFHAYTLYSAVRPYGVCIILTTWTEQNGAEMYCIETSGVSFGYYGCATGKAKQAAKTEIEKLKLDSLSTRDLLNEGAKIIYRVNEDSSDSDQKFKLELSWVGKDTNGVHQICPPHLYEEAKAAATAAMEQGDSDVE
jgi:20S proteasome subunit alpha 7